MEYILEVQEANYDVIIDNADEIGIDFGESINVIAANIYEGEYEVTPRLYERVLETGGYYMEDNVTVHEIPITQTTNLRDGLTVIIG